MRLARIATICGVVILALAAGCPRRAGRSAPSPMARARSEVAAAPPRTVSAATATDVLFRDTLRPVLSKKCAPCHEPGERMYARMPFDDPRTITSHLAGVRRRLKGEDRDALERWIASLPPQTPGR